MFNSNRTAATSLKNNCRDEDGHQAFYGPTAVIEFKGRVYPSGESAGHYLCDVKDKTSRKWFRTNEDKFPHQIETSDVSKCGYVVLYKRILTI